MLLRSDVIRKDLAGVAPQTRLDAAAYTQAATARVYAALRAQAAAVLAAGGSAVLDAVHLRPEERAAAAALAPGAFIGLWLDLAPGPAAARVAARRSDASDADAGVVAFQAGLDPGPIDWHRLDAATPPDRLLTQALSQIQG